MHKVYLSVLLIFAVNCYYAHPLLMEWLRRVKTESTYVYLNGTRLLVELPYQTVREIISEAEKARQVNGDKPYIEIICIDSEAEIQKAD
ncbi:hypothetical protein HUSEC_26916 [Escherichia coli O104:H4 str. LB226692]|nr:hypothetical protein HUSEC_26916 [Escherichia coli O104:H4 str. LB226692]